MIKRAIEVLEPGNKINKISISTITLPYDRRHCRRKKMTDDEGKSFLLDLKNATLLKDGDRLLLESENVFLFALRQKKLQILSVSRHQRHLGLLGILEIDMCPCKFLKIVN